MVSCNETFSDIVAVWPFAVGEIPYSIPFNVRRRFYGAQELGISDISDFCKGRFHYSIGEDYANDQTVELKEQKTVLKSVSDDKTPGRSFDVNLTLIINDNNDLSAKMMDEMVSSPHDFILLLADGTYLLIRTLEYGYSCRSEETFSEDYEQKLTVSLKTYNGIIRMST